MDFNTIIDEVIDQVLNEGKRIPKVMRKIVKALQDQNWTVLRTTSGHWKFVPSDPTKDIVIGSGTRSDHRALRNMISQLKRSGAVFDGKEYDF